MRRSDGSHQAKQSRNLRSDPPVECGRLHCHWQNILVCSYFISFDAINAATTVQNGNTTNITKIVYHDVHPAGSGRATIILHSGTGHIVCVRCQLVIHARCMRWRQCSDQNAESTSGGSVSLHTGQSTPTRIAVGGSAITIYPQTAYFLRPHNNGGGDCRRCVGSESNCGV